MRNELRAWFGDGSRWIEHFRKNHYEIFHLRYPSKIICAPVRIPFAAILDFLMVVDNSQT
jgi:hypothetical protein